MVAHVRRCSTDTVAHPPSLDQPRSAAVSVGDGASLRVDRNVGPVSALVVCPCCTDRPNRPGHRRAHAIARVTNAGGPPCGAQWCPVVPCGPRTRIVGSRRGRSSEADRSRRAGAYRLGRHAWEHGGALPRRDTHAPIAVLRQASRCLLHPQSAAPACTACRRACATEPGRRRTASSRATGCRPRGEGRTPEAHSRSRSGTRPSRSILSGLAGNPSRSPRERRASWMVPHASAHVRLTRCIAAGMMPHPRHGVTHAPRARIAPA